MSELLLCREPIAANPYYLDQAALNIYSLEELCYFIQRNTYLIDGQIMQEDLVSWIRRELGADRLADALDKLRSESCPLYMYVGHILKYSGYLSDDEIRKVTESISAFENKSEAEKRLARADKYMANGRVTDAVYLYNSILSPELLKTVNSQLEALVQHNLGCAYCRLFFFDRAADCFEKAYLISRDKRCLRHLMYALFCDNDFDRFDEMVAKYQITPDEARTIKNEVTSVGKSDRVAARNATLREYKNAAADDEIRASLEKMLEMIKADYRRL